MYFIKKRILVFMAILICCQTSVPSADPHPKDPNLGEFSAKKGRRESPDFEQKLFIPPYVAIPEQRTVEPLRSKNDMQDK